MSRFLVIWLGLAIPLARGEAGATQAAPRKDEPSHAGQPLSYWIKELKNENVLLREAAIEVLAYLGPAAKEAVPALTGMLKDDSRNVRFRAAVALWSIDRQAAAAVPVLIEELQGPNRAVRLRAIETLGQTGPEAKEAAPALLQAANDPDLTLRNNAAAALRRLGRVGIPFLAKMLDHENANFRLQAAEFLGRATGPAVADAAPALAAKLKDEDRRLRYKVAEVLWQLGRHDEAVAAVLTEALKEPELQFYRPAADALLNHELKPKSAGPAFAFLLKSEDALTRVRAAEALWQAERRAKDVVPVLVEGLKDVRTPNVRHTAAAALARVGPDAKDAIPALITLLKSKDGSNVGALPEALGRMGPDVVKPLADVFEEKGLNQLVYSLASQALVRTGAAGVPALVKLFEHPDANVRRSAVSNLGTMGPAAKAAVPDLVKLLKSEDAALRRAAANTLGHIGPDAREAAPALLELLKDKDVPVRQACLFPLGQVRPDAKTALPALTEALKDPDPVVRSRAADLAWQLGRDPKAVLPVHLNLLKDNNSSIRAHAVSALGRMGPEAKPAVPALLELLKVKEPFVRQAALTALKDLGADGKEAGPAAAELLRTTQPSSWQPLLPLVAHFGADAREAAPLLLNALRNPGAPYRTQVAETLVRIDPEQARAAVPALLELMQNPPYQLQAAAALWRVDPKNEAVLPTLLEGLQAQRSYTRQQAAEALGQLGPDAKKAVPQLAEALKDPFAIVRVAAALALWKIDKQTQKTIPVLLETMKPDEEVTYARHKAVEALGELGPEAKAAVPALLEARADRDPSVRIAANAALKRIDPAAAAKIGLP